MTPHLPVASQTTDEAFLRQIFVRDQMAEWSKQPLVMERADGIFYWDVSGKRYYDAIAGIYTVSVGHNNRRVIEAIRKQLDTLHFSPPMHGTNPVAVQLANMESSKPRRKSSFGGFAATIRRPGSKWTMPGVARSGRPKMGWRTSGK